jgi:ferredoxin
VVRTLEVTGVEDVLERVQTLIEASESTREEVVKASVVELIDIGQVTPKPNTENTATIEVVRAVALKKLASDFRTYKAAFASVDRSDLSPSMVSNLDTVDLQVTELYEANLAVLDPVEKSNRMWIIYVIVLLGLFGLFLIVWRRRWVSVNADECTKCSLCYQENAEFFSRLADGTAVVTDSADEGGVARLPKSRELRGKVRDMAKKCPPGAIAITIRRRK